MIRARTRGRAVLLGMILWFCAAMTVHLLPQAFDGATGSAMLLIAAVPITGVTLFLVNIFIQPSPAERLPAVVWGTAAATLADGAALSFAPKLYAGAGTATGFGAAWILWGVGLLLLAAAWTAARA